MKWLPWPSLRAYVDFGPFDFGSRAKQIPRSGEWYKLGFVFTTRRVGMV